MKNFDEVFDEYLGIQAVARQRRVAQVLSAMTKRERQLVKEVAVMAWVRGSRAAGNGHEAIPRDSEILFEVIMSCLGFEDLYPTVDRLERVARQRERRAKKTNT